MTEDKAKRKLVAVVHADVKDYSRLMGEDDEYTVRTLAANRQAMYRLVELHGGQVRDTAGDGFLVEFPSVVDAVKFSVEFQQEMKQGNADLPEDRKMEFRIGVNIGDVIHDGGTIHGDGVNVAARLEGLADPGGICISGAAYEQVKKRLDVGFEYLGEKSVKNIVEPVPTYKVLIDSDESATRKQKQPRPVRGRQRKPYLIIAGVLAVALASVGIWYSYFLSTPSTKKVASEKTPELPLPNKPSIAVLPFINMSGDPEQEYFSDGITEEIITGLAKIPQLFVIARNSSFSFKGKAVTVRDVGKKLGVRYVLEGSVRKAESNVRITAQLIDTQTGGHVWAERYDRELKDIFALQDEITRKIMIRMQVSLTQGEQARLKDERDQTDNLEAYEKVLHATVLAYRGNRETNLAAQHLYRQAIALDPSYARPYAALATCKVMAAWWGWSKSPIEDLREGHELAQKSIRINDGVSFAHYALGAVYLVMRQHDKAIAEGQKAVELSPNGADAHMWLSMFLNFADRPKEALAHINKAIRLNPMPPSTYYWTLGSALRCLNRYDEAITALKKGIQIDRDNPSCWLLLTGVASLAGRDEEARKAASEVLKLNPDLSLDHLAKKAPFRNPKRAKLIFDALRKAGLK